MLHEFITSHRDEIIARARASMAERMAPLANPLELERGVPLFLTHLTELLRPGGDSSPEPLAKSALARGNELLNMGFTVAQVVHDYGDICQAITTLAGELGATITVHEFRLLNASLDDGIAGAVTEYALQRDRWVARATTESMNAFAHDLRNILSSASLSFELLKRGTVGTGGSTGALLGRSLARLRDLIDCKLAVLRLDDGSAVLERLPIAELIEEVEIVAALEATARGVRLSVGAVARDLAVSADRQLLAAALTNLVSHAVQVTPRGAEIGIRVGVTDERVQIEVTDGGAGPDDGAEALLSLARRTAEAHAGTLTRRPGAGTGHVSVLDLPRLPPTS